MRPLFFRAGESVPQLAKCTVKTTTEKRLWRQAERRPRSVFFFFAENNIVNGGFDAVFNSFFT